MPKLLSFFFALVVTAVISGAPACADGIAVPGIPQIGGDTAFHYPPQSAPSYTGPGDVVGSALGWWGLRAYNAAYATGSNPAAIICNQSTFTTCSTINILSNGKFDAATASGSSACATTCVIKQLYDQTGNGHHLTCSSGTACPVLTFNCIGSLPCMTFAAAQPMAASGPASTAQPYTWALEFKYTTTSNTAIAGGIGGGGGDIGLEANHTSLQYFGTAPENTGTSAPNTQYDWSVVFNGATSACASNLAGAQITGTACGSSPISSIGVQLGGDPYNEYTGQAEEMGIWGSAFTTTQQGNLHTNMVAYW
jgi:hypothetical protein